LVDVLRQFLKSIWSLYLLPANRRTKKVASESRNKEGDCLCEWAVKNALAVFFCLRAVYTDLQSHKVENSWILCCLTLALGYRLCSGSSAGTAGGMVDRLADGLACGFLPLVVLFPFFCIRALGAGDLKLLAVLGLLYGIRDSGRCLALTFGFAAVAALGKLLWISVAEVRERRQRAFKNAGEIRSGESVGRERLEYMWDYLRRAACGGEFRSYRRAGFHRENLHMTVYMLAAVCVIFLFIS
jgi:Flp pilus assembly protein protease CpaA